MPYILECKNLWKWYPSPDGRLEVLRGVDLSISRGEFVAIVGASGVGKSTLLHILGLIDTQSDGEMYFDGNLFDNINANDTAFMRAQMVGFVFQFHHLLPEFTALENLLIPAMIAHKNGTKAKEHALNLLSELGVAERKNHFPAQLSGGEQQRIALARALINNPEILIADEPTGNLDSDNAHKFMQLATKMREKFELTIVLATHNIELAQYADRVLRLKNGKLMPEK